MGRILFDPGVTHSFIRTTYAIDLGLNFEKLEQALNVNLPTGEQLGTSQVCKGCVLRISEHELIVDLIALDLKGYDVIFGMDLLSTFRAVMDCFRKGITLQLLGGVVFSFINVTPQIPLGMSLHTNNHLHHESTNKIHK